MTYIRHYIAEFAYNAIWIPWYVTLKIFAHYKVVYEDRSVRRPAGPVLIVANHSSWIDPFLISGPFPMFSSVFPIHFAVWQKLFSVPGINIFVWIMGSFAVVRKIGLENTLAVPLALLARGWTVGVFPEGSRRKRVGRHKKARRGVGYLALKAHPRIVPVFVDGALGLTAKSFFSRRRHITVYVGRPLRIPHEMQEREDAREVAEFIAQKLNDLRK